MRNGDLLVVENHHSNVLDRDGVVTNLVFHAVCIGQMNH